MKLSAKVKLLTTKEQAQSLIETIKVANEACNFIGDVAWEKKTFGQFNLHKLVYYEVREKFNLSAQVTVRCISKVADSYKLDKKTKRTFKPLSAIAYDDRILKWKPDKREVSIWTIDGRLSIPFVTGERQLELLKSRQGESDLILHRGKLYLVAACNVDEPDPADVDDFLGIDLGVANLAVSSDGDFYSGSHVKSVRYRQQKLRSKLQSKGTRSAKRKLKQLSGKEFRFSNDVNHCISKEIVENAQRTGRGIALEKLSGIRDRIRARRNQRRQLHNWSFYDLQHKILYKARIAGVPVEFINPAYTSQTCPVCGCVDKRNRKSQDSFSCIRCGSVGHADYFASVNIRRAAINPPNVATASSG